MAKSLEALNNLFHPENGGFQESLRVPKRPLGKTSDFVVEQLPSRLNLVRSGELSVSDLSAEIEPLLPSKMVTKLVRPGSDQDLALLDLKMLMFGIVHSNGEPGKKLKDLVKKFAFLCDQPESITYEEIIMVNPADDPRLFTNGEVGQAEYDFYHTHRLIEPILEEALVSARLAKTSLKQGKASGLNAAAYINICTAFIKNASQFVETVGQKMDPDQFTTFRAYLTDYKAADLPGPSGAFTARIPLLDMMLAGEQFPKDYYESIAGEGKLRFFPRDGRGILKDEIVSSLSNTNESFAKLNKEMGGHWAVGQELGSMRDALIGFRGKHYRGVVKQLPGAVNDPNAVGTSGLSGLGKYLRERVKYLNALTFDN